MTERAARPPSGEARGRGGRTVHTGEDGLNCPVDPREWEFVENERLGGFTEEIELQQEQLGILLFLFGLLAVGYELAE
jgi:hypothetical protein